MKRVLIAIVVMGCISSCASMNQNLSAKKKMKKYNMYMNDHPGRDHYQKY